VNRNLFFIIIFAAVFVGVALDQATGNLLFGTVIVVAAVILFEIYYRKADTE
jgi:hypothetical protein